jgi:hypothetical protein
LCLVADKWEAPACLVLFQAQAKVVCQHFQAPQAAYLPFRALLVAFHRFRALLVGYLLCQVLLVSNRSILKLFYLMAPPSSYSAAFSFAED